MRPRLHLADLGLVAALLAALLTMAPRLSRPPLDGHSWRQSLAANVARSYRCGQPFWLPRVDACGNAPLDGVQAMELPLYAAAMAALASLAGPYPGERLVSLAGALLLLFGLFSLTRRLCEHKDPDAARGGGAFAALACTGTYLFLYYGGALIPDVLAYGLAAFGAAWVLGEGGITPRWALVAGSLALSIAIGTKLVAAPALAVSGWVLLFRVATRKGERRRHAADLGLHLALAAAIPALWYGLWMPHLKTLETCHLFWLAPQEALAQLDRALPGKIHAKLVELLGAPGRIALYLAVPIALVSLRWRSVALLGLWVGAALVWALLGWHREVHEYDHLLFLTPAALTLGSALAGLVSLLPERARLVAALALPVALAAPRFGWARGELPRREKTENGALPFLARDLDRALSPEQPILAPGTGQDPRLAYFSGRIALNSDDLDCGRPARYDCAVVLRPGAPVCGKNVSSVYWPDKTLTCGLAGESDPIGAVRARLAATLARDEKASRSPDVPGLGRFLGFDAPAREGEAHVDLYFLANGQPLAAELVSATGGAPQRPPGIPPEGSLFVLRIAGAPPGRFSLAVGPLRVDGETREIGDVETRCPVR